jgi:type IV pilus assembly protein PilO
MDPKEKQKLYVLCAIVGLAAILFYYNLLLKPQFTRFIINNREFHSVKARVKAAENLIANSERIKKQYENIKKEAGFLERKFPVENKISGLLEDFSAIAESSGISILKIKPVQARRDSSKKESGPETYSEFPMLIEAKGGYHQCGAFIDKLENLDTFIKIDGIDISQNSGDARKHDIKLKLVTYVVQ